ncbi:MAG: hypothetical protein ABS75_13225 [Pelagibacterium sp. SCN 63-23]|nr:MAG: hypothetical protein ABS75_13225 [Pelagibacterium sp. SCN 63-23]
MEGLRDDAAKMGCTRGISKMERFRDGPVRPDCSPCPHPKEREQAPQVRLGVGRKLGRDAR